LRSPGARAKSDPDALSWSRLSRKPLQEPKSPATENWNEMASSEEAGVPTKERPTRAIAAARRTAMARLGPNVAPMTSRPVPVSLPEYFSFSWHLAHKCTRGFDPKGPGGPTEADSLGRPTVSGDPNMSGGRYPFVLWRDGLASAPASVPPSRDEQVGSHDRRNGHPSTETAPR